MTQNRHAGLAAGVASYALWGFVPLFWPLLKPAGALEVLAHRVVWSLVLVGLGLAVTGAGWRWLRAAFAPGQRLAAVAASVLIAANWGVYIWAVNAGLVVEASLGYFINPLVVVALASIVFGERLRAGGRVGLALASIGVLVIGWEHLATLWVSLVLAGSFATYGVLKKRTTLTGLQGMFVESALLTPLALGYLIALGVSGTGAFGQAVPSSLLLAAAGPITAVPLWLFAIAASRLPFGVVGVLQYLAPTIQFVLGVTVFGQQPSLTYWLGLVIVWTGCVAFLTSAVRCARERRALALP